jgi:Flagellar biosynthesis pathway, component FliQ
MSQGEILNIFKDAIMTAALLAAPALVVTAVVGLAVSIIQAATQIQEQSVSFILKLIAVALVILLLSSWGITTMLDYMGRLYDSMSHLS